ncbi:hypothetical protein D3C87_1777550 [compost metagenome]
MGHALIEQRLARPGLQGLCQAPEQEAGGIEPEIAGGQDPEQEGQRLEQRRRHEQPAPVEMVGQGA